MDLIAMAAFVLIALSPLAFTALELVKIPVPAGRR